MLVARLYRDFRDWLLLDVARRLGRNIWLRVGPIWFMNVIDNDGPITIDGSDRNVCRGISPTIDLSNYVVLPV